MRSDPIVIRAYDRSWPSSFELQRRLITPVLTPWITRDIEHMGSTAVPGLAAKDIIDMLAVVADVDEVRDSIPRMERVGWVHAPEPTDQADRQLSVCFPGIAYRTHHLHVVEEQSDDWRGWLAFRDYLRSHRDAAIEYASLKMSLATEHGHDPNHRDDYRNGKADFIRRMTARARSETA